MLSVPGWYLGSRCQTEAGRLQALLSYRKFVGLQNFPPSAVATHREHRRGVEEFGEHGKEEEPIQTNQLVGRQSQHTPPTQAPTTGSLTVSIRLMMLVPPRRFSRILTSRFIFFFFTGLNRQKKLEVRVLSEMNAAFCH